MKTFRLFFLVILFVSTSFAQRELGARPTETGGVVPYEQAAYDFKLVDFESS